MNQQHSEERKTTARTTFLFLLLLSCLGASAATPLPAGNPGNGPLDQWELYSIDPAMEWTPIYLTAADLNGDHRLDLVAGGWWYENPGSIEGTWTKHTIGGDLNNVGWVDDFDGDGDLDLIGTDGKPNGGNLRWARNNGSGSFTVFSNLDFGQATFFQGAIGGVFSSGAPYLYMMQWEDGEFGANPVEGWIPPADPSTGTWPKSIVNRKSLGEQMSKADLDNDGDLDIFQGTAWLRNEGTEGWRSFTIATIAAGKGGADRNVLADIDRDGDLDAVVGLSHFDGDSTYLLWLEHPADPTQTWAQHIIVDGKWGGHSVDAADIDFDGDIDVVLGEHRGNRRAFIYENVNNGNSWVEHLLDAGAVGRDHHNGTLLFDLDGDGDLDIADMGWDNHKVWIFKNIAPGGADTEAPSTPANVDAEAVSSSRIDIDWSASSDNRAVHHYLVRRNGSQVGNVPGNVTSFSDTGLTSETTYSYTVIAVDAAGNQSDPSSPASATTPADDGEPPSVPTNLDAEALSPGHVQLDWSASTDNVQVDHYRVLRNGAQVGTTANTEYLDAGLQGGQTYNYVVTAVDTSGLESGPSSSAQATTPNAPPAPTSGLILWLRADAGVEAAGNALSQWSDQSGQNHDATQTTSESRPTVHAGALGGRPAVAFDGEDDFLNFNLPINGLTGMSIFMVAANTQSQVAGPSQAERAALFWNETIPWGTVYLCPFQTELNLRFGTTQANNSPGYRRSQSVGSSFTLSTAVHSGTTDSAYVNGVQVVNEGGKLTTIAGCADNASLARGFDNNTFYAGEIAEVLVYNRGLSTDERQTVETYLGSKYGLSVPLTNPGTVSPSLAIRLIGDNSVEVTLTGPAGETFSIERSGDFENWTLADTATLPNSGSPATWQNTYSIQPGKMFFRARQ